MSSGMIFVLAIVAIGMLGGILKARYGHRDDAATSADATR